VFSTARRRIAFAVFSAFAITLGVAGCGRLDMVTATPLHANIVVSLPNGYGVVEGGIIGCYDFGGNTSPPVYHAGTVTAYRGAVVSANQAPFRSSVVRAGAEYTFVLPQGTYVIVGHDPSTDLSPLPSAEVTVLNNSLTIQDLQYYGCI
jgi:hypothetical protein